jgi:antitoxin Phd
MPSPATFRNIKGDLVSLQSVPATQLKNGFSTVLDRAMHDGAVAITRHDQPRAVLVSYEEFIALTRLRSPELGELTSQFDALLAGMQSAKSKKGAKAAFDATPAELGRTAVKAARKR